MLALSLHLILAAAAATPAPSPVEACRSAHAGDAARHIACLEAALQPTSAAATPAATPSGLGAEQLRSSRDREPAQESVTLAAVSYDALGRGVFRTTTGATWRETESGRRASRLAPDRQYDARIERAAMGGYRMYIEGVRRMLKVERVE